MKERRFYSSLLSLLILAGACLRAQADPAEDAFKGKFDAVRIGMTQKEVATRLGSPAETKTQIEAEDQTVQSMKGPIVIHKGDTTKVWVYSFGNNNYTLCFAARNTNDPLSGVLFARNVISVGNPVQIK